MCGFSVSSFMYLEGIQIIHINLCMSNEYGQNLEKGQCFYVA